MWQYGDTAGAARLIKPERGAGERDHAVVESSRIAQSSAPGVACRGNGVDSPQIVGSLIPGIEPEQKAASAGHFVHLSGHRQEY